VVGYVIRVKCATPPGRPFKTTAGTDDAKQEMDSVERILSRVPPPVVIAGALAAVLAIGLLDGLTGIYLSFALFYLIPIIAVVWACGRTLGLLLAGVATTVGAASDMWFRAGHLGLVPVWNAGVRFGIFCLVATVLSRLHTSLENEARLARTDSLTGAANSRWFSEVIERELARAHRYGHDLTLAYVDVDDFKAVNDEFGHAAGDLLLCTVADAIAENVRPSDIVARLGGDEFAVLLPETDVESTAAAFTRIRFALLERLQEKGWRATVSVGIASADETCGADALISAGDELMYEAKRAGKDRIAWDASASLIGADA
jgi:diguanylate cyclase (GGDEF)-like protein